MKKNAPIVVGLDPKLSMIPDRLRTEAAREGGTAVESAARSFFLFNKEIIDAVFDLIPAVKPQSAMYELLGIPGLQAYRDTIEYAKSKGLIVIGDIKRGDIGSTSEAYALAHLGKVSIDGAEYEPFGEDIATVNPYLGSDGVKPFIEVCKTYGKGIFVLVKTSNPSSGEFQDRIIDSRPLYEHVAKKVDEWGREVRNGEYSAVGAVTGATYPEEGKRLRELMPHTMLLVPGYGAQGARGSDLKYFFRKDGSGAIVNSSRGIIAAWQQERYAHLGTEAVGEAARAAVIDMRDDIRATLV